VSEPLSRLYDLALRTLDDQERRADALRTRLGPVLAAAALGVTLLGGPVVGGDSPRTLAGTVALLVAVGGLFIAVVVAASMLRARRTACVELDILALAERSACDAELEDLPTFYLTMISRLGREMADNAALLDRLHTQFTAMLCGILVMLCGLALAALVG
jgi:hypothetical protein